MRRRTTKAKFAGYTIVPLHEVCVREAVRFWRDGYRMALLQKNGNVAVSGSGIFDRDGDTHPVASANVARALVGLKLFPVDWAQPFIEAEDAHKRQLDLVSLEADADRLDMRVVPMAATIGMKL